MIKKKLLTILMVLCLMLPMFSGCKKKNDNNNLNWNGLSIVDFENYSAIGAAVLSQGASNASFNEKNVAYAKDNEKPKLVGITKDNKCKEIKFKDDKGNISEQKANLVHFYALKYYSFAVFSMSDNVEYKYFDNETNYRFDTYGSIWLETGSGSGIVDRGYFFIIDNSTGKIYDLNKVTEVIKEQFGSSSFFHYSFINISNFLNWNMVYFDTNFLLIDVIFSQYNYEHFIYQIDFTENDIQLKQRMNSVQVKNFCGKDVYNVECYTDRFGNIFNVKPSVLDYESTIKVQKKDGFFAELQGTFSFKENGVLYKKDGDKNYYFNENGEFVEIDSNKIVEEKEEYAHKFYSATETGLFYADEFCLMYFSASQLSTMEGMRDEFLVMKVSFDEDFTYKYEYLMLDSSKTSVNEVYNASLCYYKNKIYMLNSNGKFLVFDATTGECEEFESEYSFSGLKFNKDLNRVEFKAINKTTMMDVEGYFDENNQIKVGKFKHIEGVNKVFVIKPVN